MEWNTGSPKENGRYLVVIKHRRKAAFDIDIVSFATNLYLVDSYYFPNLQRAGWYSYDYEVGLYERKDVIAWMPLPQLPAWQKY